MKAKIYEVNLADELRRIGSGYRIVVVKEGNKWVHVCDTHGENKTRIKKSLWNNICIVKETTIAAVKEGKRLAAKQLYPNNYQAVARKWIAELERAVA